MVLWSRLRKDHVRWGRRYKATTLLGLGCLHIVRGLQTIVFPPPQWDARNNLGYIRRRPGITINLPGKRLSSSSSDYWLVPNEDGQ
jgi:hypothetical protein